MTTAKRQQPTDGESCHDARPNARSRRLPTGFDLTPPSDAERARLESGLTAEERDVLLRHGTEAPFCGGLLGNKEDGVYCCRLCGLPLFRAKTKFESGTGWPSFFAPYRSGAHARPCATSATA